MTNGACALIVQVFFTVGLCRSGSPRTFNIHSLLVFCDDQQWLCLDSAGEIQFSTFYCLFRLNWTVDKKIVVQIWQA